MLILITLRIKKLFALLKVKVLSSEQEITLSDTIRVKWNLRRLNHGLEAIYHTRDPATKFHYTELYKPKTNAFPKWRNHIISHYGSQSSSEAWVIWGTLWPITGSYVLQFGVIPPISLIVMSVKGGDPAAAGEFWSDNVSFMD